MKQRSRWSSRAEVRQRDTYPGTTELRLIGYLTESTRTPKSKSNMLTPKTNSQTYWPRAISLVMSGKIFSICSISAFSALPVAPKWCQKECKQEQEKNCGKVEANVEPGLAYCGKLFHSAEFECIKSSGDTQSTQPALSFQECARKLAAENSDINDEDDPKWPHNYRISRANVPHLEKLHSNLRQQLERKTNWRTSIYDDMEDRYVGHPTSCRSFG